ncbi:unnamed protein product [Protopolystoma xenopodis]|uniref:dTMP kinase n=1 Tax=Protopolystoma xenopodis TaxID=117903 RepID=A0A448WVQ4_9PLAT|nr:unnamed protein product [Protopolystoma xenopodis]
MLSWRSIRSTTCLLALSSIPRRCHQAMSTLRPRGLFIVLEGIDRSGKSTQAGLLRHELTSMTNREAVLVHFPDRETPIGKGISDYLTGKVDMEAHAIHLLFTANRWERNTDILAALEDGRCVIADRYSYSGIAYSAAKPDPPDWEWSRKVEHGLAQPDVVICLTPDKLTEVEKRAGFGDERYETCDFQLKVLGNYLRISKEMDAEHAKVAHGKKLPIWNWIEATGLEIDEVHKCIVSTLEPYLIESGLIDEKAE